jgi:PhoPQ-activated pathogenicity-related protein
MGAALSRIESLEDRALLSGTPGGSSTLPTLTPGQQTALDTYVAAADSSYHFALNSTLTGTGYTDYVINMVSQTWTPSTGDSQVWQHWVQIIVPTTVSTHTALLNISGGSNTQSAPTTPDQLSLLAATTLNAITVFLPTVPNEPVTFPAQGETTPLTEDQIVAYTFEQFLHGNGQDWPLLLPMVKSAVRAMDTTQSFVASQSGGTLSVSNFIVTGASKRGWTTWLTPAVDTRVVAIVPYVFDGLNLADQVESQLDTYVGVTQDVVNGDSTAVQDYTGDGVFNFLGTPQMSSLLSIVDPYSYVGRSTYNIPKYLIASTGDQFFVPGAQFYFSNLPGENYLRYLPNTDHGLNSDAVTGALNFEKALLDGATLPQFNWNVSNSGTTITLNSVTTPTSVTMWQATNTTNRDFRLETFGANWTSSTLTDQGGGKYVAQVTPPTTGATDFFIQMQYSVDGVTLTFTTQISTVPLLTPTVVATDANGNFNGNPFAATATASGRASLPVPGNFSFSYYAGSTVTGTPLPSAPTQPGTYTVVAAFTSSDPDYVTGPTSSFPVTFVINPLPLVNAPASASVNQNATLAFSGPNAITVTDTAGGGNNNETLTLGVVDGTLTFVTTTGLTITGNGTASVSASGPLASLNADLASLVYAPTVGFNGSDTLSLTILDVTDQAQGNPASVAITVVPPLAVMAPPTASVNENASLMFSSTNGNAITVRDITAGSLVEQVTLVATHGTIKLGSTHGLTFVSGLNNSASMTVKGTLANLNTDLNGLTFKPTAGYSGSASLSVTFQDLVSNQTASATVAITVIVPASTVTATITTPMPFAVPFEPVPFLIGALDTNAAAQAASFTFNITWGDGNSRSLSSKSPHVLSHGYRRPGLYTVSVTATDEFGHTSAPATVSIRVEFAFVGIDPFDRTQTALFVGGTGGNDTVSFAASGTGGTAVTLNGVSQGTFTTSGPLIVFTGGRTDTVTEGAGVTNSLFVALKPTDFNLEADLQAEVANTAGFNAAMEVLSS